MKKLSVFVVGRHEPRWPDDFEPVVVGQDNITFSAYFGADDLADLFGWVASTGAEAVIFQAFPTQLVGALVNYALRAQADNLDTHPWYPLVRVGGIVNEPRPDLRKSPTTIERQFTEYMDAGYAADLVRAANPRAKVEVDGDIVRVTVDAPMPFRPIKIIWF